MSQIVVNLTELQSQMKVLSQYCCIENGSLKLSPELLANPLKLAQLITTSKLFFKKYGPIIDILVTILDPKSRSSYESAKLLLTF